MATALRKPSPSVPPSPATGSKRSVWERFVGVCDAIYRFLASLKLAVISLGTLAAVLAYATFFESWYGAAAAQEWIYRSAGFAILLTFLGANILCAALIRYPWKKRQTGFVITHAGLLIILAGSWLSLKSADEGQVGMLEGQTMSQLVRRDDAIIRVRKIDPHTGEAVRDFGEFELPFRPGHFEWGQGHPRPHDLLGSLIHLVTFGTLEDRRPTEVLTRPNDPFQLKVKHFLPASVPALAHEPDPAGNPMAKIRPRFKAPGMPQAREVLSPDEQWFTADKSLGRIVKDVGPARFAFLYVDKPEFVDDFRNPPENPGKEGVARFHYRDRDGKARKFDWALDGQEGKSTTLPDSDLNVTFSEIRHYPAAQSAFGRLLGEPTIPVASFKVRKGSGEEFVHAGWDSLPLLPTVASPEQKLCDINYIRPPVLDPKGNGLFGLVEVLGTPDGSLYYRVFGRGEHEVGRIRSSGVVKKGEQIAAFGGNPNMPMNIAFQVEDFLPSAVEKEICERVELPKGKKDEGIEACLLELTIDGEKRDLWVRRSATLDELWQQVEFPNGVYSVAYDVDRKPLNFQLKLVDFDRLFDPGTEQPSRFVSKVLMTDEDEGIKETPITIAMNSPLTHRGYTFYQSSYQPEFDPRTNEETGRFISILQVATDPGRPIKYFGCALVVAGAFVQFYMRAGIFTDGGKRERAREDARRRKQERGTESPETTVSDVTESEEIL